MHIFLLYKMNLNSVQRISIVLTVTQLQNFYFFEEHEIKFEVLPTFTDRSSNFIILLLLK